MKNEVLFATADKVLRAVGVEADETCLDFGCGHGNYTIPLARIVGPAGTVYALDKDEGELDKLVERAREAGLDNIVRIDSPGDLEMALDDGSVDVILLYDVLHSHYFSAEQRDALFREIGRVAAGVLRQGFGARRPKLQRRRADRALLSIFPNHMEPDEIEQEVVRRAAGVGFENVHEYRGPVVHDDGVIDGHIVTFGRGRSDR